MKREQISDNAVDNMVESLRTAIEFRLEQKGRGSVSSIHEILGIITEEYQELIDAVKSNRHDRIQKELIDLAVGAIFGAQCISEKKVD